MDPEDLHSQLINVFHGSMAHPHVSAQRKSSYAKILAMLAQDQAQAHANQSRQPSASPGGMGGVQTPEDSGYPTGEMVASPLLAALHGGGMPPQGPLAQGYGQDLLGVLRGHAYG